MARRDVPFGVQIRRRSGYSPAFFQHQEGCRARRAEYACCRSIYLITPLANRDAERWECPHAFDGDAIAVERRHAGLPVFKLVEGSLALANGGADAIPLTRSQT